jgi:magnesium chelatase family protein
MRQRNPLGLSNRELSAQGLQRHGRFKAETICHWEEVMRSRRLSMRSGLRLLRVARTVADLHESEAVDIENLASALCFRSFDLSEP